MSQGHDWVFEVLADIRSYSTENGLDCLANYLDEAALVLAEDLARKSAPVSYLKRANLDPKGKVIKFEIG